MLGSRINCFTHVTCTKIQISGAPDRQEMDPLSAASSAVGLVAFCGKIIESVGKFVYDSREAADSISSFYDTIITLQKALENLGEVLQLRPRPLAFERDHYKNIFRIIQSCTSAVAKLDAQLPLLPAEPGSMAKARATLDMKLRSNTIQQTISHIASYTQVLQLSLMTLYLGTLWSEQSSQNQIGMQIRELTGSIRSANLAAKGPETGRAPEQTPP